MDVQLLTRPEDFAALREEWGRLYARCARRSVFLTHEWFDAAWQWRQRSAELYLLCCRNAGELVGALPLIRERDPETSRGRALELLTVPDTQACDVLTPEDGGAEAVGVLADELMRRQSDWDVLRLSYLPDTSVAATTLAGALAARGSRCELRATTGNPFVVLDSSWDTYYATRSRRLKKANNLVANRLRKAGGVRIDWLAPNSGNPTDVDRMVAAIVDISARSWKTRTGNSLDNAGPRAFINRLSQLAHRQGWLSVWTLTLDNEPLAMEYQLAADGNVYALRSDFQAQYEQISPGSYLSRHLLEQLFGRGWRRYLMGPGENAYKYRWAQASEPVHQLTVYGRSLRGKALASWEQSVKPAVRSIRDRALKIVAGDKPNGDIDEPAQ
jgi:CelD/BcsL family acetyltransferase involved in cellulose biosynthesis